MTSKQKTRKARNTRCLNCDTPLESAFCSHCGQKNKDYRLSFKDLFSDLLEEVLDVDSRLVQSIRYLFTKPGFLTREYVQGRRVSYLPPLRLYLVASVLFFLSMSLMTVIPELRSNRLIQGFSETRDLDSTLTRIEALGALDQALSLESSLSDSLDGNLTVSINNQPLDFERNDFLSSFRDNFAKMMFLLLPVAALLLKMLYWRRKKLYVEHLIFSLHVHAFIFSLLILTAFLEYRILVWLVILASLIYLYMAMHFYYGQSRTKTGAKMILLLLSYGVSLLLVMTLTMLVTAFDQVLAMGA